MTDLELRGLSATMATIVREFFEAESLKLRAMFAAVVAERIRELPAGRDGKDGQNGKDGRDGERGERGPEGIVPDIVEAVRLNLNGIADHILSRVPPSVNGKDGRDGKDCACASGLDGKQGEPGERGPQGPAGEKGDRGEAGPQGERGDKGESGERGSDGELGPAGIGGLAGKDGRDGIDGKDGRSVELHEVEAIADAALLRHVSQWELDFERRAQEHFQRVIEKLPTPKDGKDGLSLADFSGGQDEDGDVTLRLASGDLTKEVKLRLRGFRDRGVFVEGERYLQNDGVTFGGSFWISQKDEPSGKPGNGSSDWRLAVKKGRDGRDGKAPLPEGPVNL